jgi:hypothetical protein
MRTASRLRPFSCRDRGARPIGKAVSVAFGAIDPGNLLAVARPLPASPPARAKPSDPPAAALPARSEAAHHRPPLRLFSEIVCQIGQFTDPDYRQRATASALQTRQTAIEPAMPARSTKKFCQSSADQRSWLGRSRVENGGRRRCSRRQHQVAPSSIPATLAALTASAVFTAAPSS